MNTDDLVNIEYYRRWLRPDWRRWLHPDCERGLTPEQIKTQRHDFMLRDLAFETPRERRLRKEAEERAQIEQERLETEHRAEIEREALKIKAEIAAPRFELVWAEFCPQVRVQPEPAARAGGQSGRRAMDERHPVGTSRPATNSLREPKPMRLAQYSIGTLAGQSRVRGGWKCFYKFSFGIIMVDGTKNFGCSPRVPAAGVSHGTLIANDN